MTIPPQEQRQRGSSEPVSLLVSSFGDSLSLEIFASCDKKMPNYFPHPSRRVIIAVHASKDRDAEGCHLLSVAVTDAMMESSSPIFLDKIRLCALQNKLSKRRAMFPSSPLLLFHADMPANTVLR